MRSRPVPRILHPRSCWTPGTKLTGSAGCRRWVILVRCNWCDCCSCSVPWGWESDCYSRPAISGLNLWSCSCTGLIVGGFLVVCTFKPNASFPRRWFGSCWYRFFADWGISVGFMRSVLIHSQIFFCLLDEFCLTCRISRNYPLKPWNLFYLTFIFSFLNHLFLSGNCNFLMIRSVALKVWWFNEWVRKVYGSLAKDWFGYFRWVILIVVFWI